MFDDPTILRIFRRYPKQLRYEHLPRLIALSRNDDEQMAAVVELILERGEIENDAFDELLLAACNALPAEIRRSAEITELMMRLCDVPGRTAS
ncbi:MAG: hypothetical protein DHS20C03_02660 [Minwuia thermotolerans]|nr:MAG: hypothetical protein DHS20C03_02660 [Minwuia thermotolerans]